jgi:hypothetical protein
MGGLDQGLIAHELVFLGPARPIRSSSMRHILLMNRREVFTIERVISKDKCGILSTKRFFFKLRITV